MFIAQMYMYGRDPWCVGIDGIQGCMGVFALYNDNLFAIHVPCGSEDSKKEGLDTFINYFMTQNPSYFEGAKLYIAFRKNQRGEGVEAEAREYGRRLNAKETCLIEIDVSPNDCKALSVVCVRKPHNTGQVALWYQDSDKIKWEHKGNERDGYYRIEIGDEKYSCEVGYPDWTWIDGKTAVIKKLRKEAGCLII
jgi:hypothetical protein